MSTKLILINFGVFVLLNIFVYLFAFLIQKTELYQDLSFWLMVPASAKNLIMQPWSLLTYMFMHSGIWHIISNMLILWIFGRILNDLLGNRKILPIYILGGLAGAMMYIVFYNIFPVFQDQLNDAYLVGASAAVMSIMLAATTLSPNYSIRLFLIGDIKIKYIALFFILLDLMLLTQSNPGGHLAHLGGAIFGYLFVAQLQKGNDWSITFNRWTDKITGLLEKRPARPKVVYKRQMTPEDKATFGGGMGNNYRTERVGKKRSFSKDKQVKIDEILDKIAQSGYDSLTAEEKAFLFEVSNEDPKK